MGTALWISSIAIILSCVILSFPSLPLVYKVANEWKVVNVGATGDGMMYLSHPSRLASQHALAVAYRANS